MKKPTIEAQIVQGLESFADALETGEDITSRFTCHKVILDLQPTSYKPDLVKKTRLVLGMSQALFARFWGCPRARLGRGNRGRDTRSQLHAVSWMRFGTIPRGFARA